MNQNKNTPELRFPEFTGEWERKKLSEVTTWASGGTPPKDNDNYWNGTIPWISASSMRGLEYSDSNLKITQAGLKNGSKLATKGTLLILVRGSMLFNTIPIGIAVIDVAFNQDVKSISVNEESTSKYVLYWFIFLEPKILSMVTGTGIGAGKLDLTELKSLDIPLPSLPEQQKIATFLSAIDGKLQALKKKKALLEQYKKGVMQAIFSQQVRFKDENGEDYPDWEEKKVREIFKITRGNVLSMSLVRHHSDELNIYPVYSSQTKNKGLSGYYDKYLYENCITWTTDGANAGDVNYRNGRFYCTNVCGVLISETGYANLFISEMLNTVSRKYVSYVGNPKLMNNVMAEITITIPKSIKEQTKIANFLTSIDEKLTNCQAQIEQTDRYKKGLLQKMFC